jgi:hypothetical protein
MLVAIATVLHALVVRFGGQNMPFLLYATRPHAGGSNACCTRCRTA